MDKGKNTQNEKSESKEKKDELTIKEQYNFTVGQIKKIKWAKRKEVINGTIIVCTVSLGAVLYFGVIDYVVDLVKGLI